MNLWDFITFELRNFEFFCGGGEEGVLVSVNYFFSETIEKIST